MQLTASPETMRYLERNIEQFKSTIPRDEWDELDLFAGNDSPFVRAYVDAAIGKVTHHSRCRIKTDAYDWQKLNAWMTKHHITNESLALLYRIQYKRNISVGTIANIRCGSYTYSDTAKRVMAIMESCE